MVCISAEAEVQSSKLKVKGKRLKGQVWLTALENKIRPEANNRKGRPFEQPFRYGLERITSCLLLS
jgi:hypothetical protein